jgi:hypothetical protein
MAKEASLDVGLTYSEARKTYDLSYRRAWSGKLTVWILWGEKIVHSEMKSGLGNIFKFNIHGSVHRSMT